MMALVNRKEKYLVLDFVGYDNIITDQVIFKNIINFNIPLSDSLWYMVFA